jgi:hypothetical protein
MGFSKEKQEVTKKKISDIKTSQKIVTCEVNTKIRFQEIRCANVKQSGSQGTKLSISCQQ